jgi:hypothetical protein
MAALRSLAGEAGCTLEKAPNRGCWFLISDKDGKPAVSDRGTTAFTVDRAIKFLSRAAPNSEEAASPQGR